MLDELNIDDLLNKKEEGWYAVAQKQHITGKWITVTRVKFTENDKEKALKKIARRYKLWCEKDGNEKENIKLYEISVFDGKYDCKELAEVQEQEVKEDNEN